MTRVIRGDCLEVLPTLAAGSIDAVIADPPYMVGAISVGNGSSKSGTWVDMENSAYWFAAWFQACKRILKSTGYLCSFGNWRSIPTLIRALSLADMPATSCVVWDKEWIGPAGPQQLRPTFEIIMISAMPEAKIDDRSLSDIWRCQWMAGNSKTTIHPAEKPVPLLVKLCETVSPPGGLILDPFAGSGTAGVAAAKSGRRAILIEREDRYLPIIQRRLDAAATPLFADSIRSGQG